MQVVVDPADVVSVPVDYSHAKMRVCRYEVLKCVKDVGFQTFQDQPIYFYNDGRDTDFLWEDEFDVE